MSWKHLGTEGLGRLIEMTNDLAAHLADRCRELGEFELAIPRPELSVVCFRHVPGGMDGADLDSYQDRLQRALEVDGTGWLSTTRLRGRTYLRAGIVNYLASPGDVDRVLEALIRLSPSVR
jgi:aromatic-L-amino-acid/L-tryptophan decarboxylase